MIFKYMKNIYVYFRYNRRDLGRSLEKYYKKKWPLVNVIKLKSLRETKLKHDYATTNLNIVIIKNRTKYS